MVPSLKKISPNPLIFPLLYYLNKKKTHHKFILPLLSSIVKHILFKHDSIKKNICCNYFLPSITSSLLVRSLWTSNIWIWTAKANDKYIKHTFKYFECVSSFSLQWQTIKIFIIIFHHYYVLEAVHMSLKEGKDGFRSRCPHFSLFLLMLIGFYAPFRILSPITIQLVP